MVAYKLVCFVTSVVLHVLFFLGGVKTNTGGKAILRFVMI
jgi:hypothetical protein